MSSMMARCPSVTKVVHRSMQKPIFTKSLQSRSRCRAGAAYSALPPPQAPHQPCGPPRRTRSLRQAGERIFVGGEPEHLRGVAASAELVYINGIVQLRAEGPNV